jgi:transcription elongation factor B subunit 1
MTLFDQDDKNKYNYFLMATTKVIDSDSFTKAAVSDSGHVRLISEDGVEFVIERETALFSRTISMFLEPSLGFEESSGTIHLYGIPGRLVERVCSFLHHRRRWDGQENHPVWEIGAEESLDLLLIADYLEM